MNLRSQVPFWGFFVLIERYTFKNKGLLLMPTLGWTDLLGRRRRRHQRFDRSAGRLLQHRSCDRCRSRWLRRRSGRRSGDRNLDRDRDGGGRRDWFFDERNQRLGGQNDILHGHEARVELSDSSREATYGLVVGLRQQIGREDGDTTIGRLVRTFHLFRELVQDRLLGFGLQLRNRVVQEGNLRHFASELALGPLVPLALRFLVGGNLASQTGHSTVHLKRVVVRIGRGPDTNRGQDDGQESHSDRQERSTAGRWLDGVTVRNTVLRAAWPCEGIVCHCVLLRTVTSRG